MVIVEHGCSSGNVKGKTDLRNIWGMYQEHLIIDGTIEEKERDGLKKNLNYVGSHQFDPSYLLNIYCTSHRADALNTH